MRSPCSLRVALFSGAALVAALGCTKSNDTPQSTVASNWQTTTMPGKLPIGHGEGSCESTGQQFDLCKWACHAEAVFVGRVVSTTTRFAPVSVASSDADPPYLEACPEGGQVQPSLDITVEVIDVLRGELELSSVVTVTYPVAAMSGWSPAVEADATGALVWTSSEAVPFKADSVVGIKASKVSYQATEHWSAFAEAPFTFTETWNAVLIEGDRGPTVPADVKEASYSGFRAMVAACPQSSYCDDVAAARAAVPPERLLAASCLPPAERPDIDGDDP